MNKLLQLKIEDKNTDLFVEVDENNNIVKEGKIDDWIVSKSVHKGVNVAIIELSDCFWLITLNPITFVDKIDKKVLHKKSDVIGQFELKFK